MGGPLLRAAAAGAGAAAAGAAFLAWAARGRSASVFAPSIYRGPRERRAVALTFDDGPTPSTVRLMEVLARLAVPATFFACGVQARRLPSVLREAVAYGHEIGNHTETHRRLWLQPAAVIRSELQQAQESIAQATGVRPKLFRPPYGVRWFGLRAAQSELGLLGVMWTTIGLDWKLNAEGVTTRVVAGHQNGAIICLHDGRELAPDPDIRNTISAVERIVPLLRTEGYEFCTVSALLKDSRNS